MSASTAWFKTRGRPELGVMTVIVADLRSPTYSPRGLLRSDSFHLADHAASLEHAEARHRARCSAHSTCRKTGRRLTQGHCHIPEQQLLLYVRRQHQQIHN